jgi:hypothetical protein
MQGFDLTLGDPTRPLLTFACGASVVQARHVLDRGSLPMFVIFMEVRG